MRSIAIIGWLIALTTAGWCRADDSVATFAKDLQRLLHEVQPALPPGWQAAATPNVPPDVAIPWRPLEEYTVLVIWRTEKALGEPNVPGMPGGNDPDDRPWEEMQPTLQFTCVDYLSADEYAARLHENRAKLAQRNEFIERELAGIPRSAKEGNPARPSSFRPISAEQRERVRKYEDLWARTEPVAVPTHYYERLAFIFDTDGYNLRDKAVAAQRDAIQQAVLSLVTTYHERPVAAARAEGRNVVATVLGRDILAYQIEPNAAWYRERETQIAAGMDPAHLTSPDEYRGRTLAGLIAGPLFEAFRTAEKLEPTEEELTEFLEHYQLAKVRSRQKRQQELARLKQRADDLESQLESSKLTAAQIDLLTKQLDQVQKKIRAIERADELLDNRHGILSRDAERDRQFAEWTLRRWNLQAALYHRYGGRAVWQQVGIEAADAMRDYLREQESQGIFTIRDDTLRAKFWAIYAPEKLLFTVPDPDRIFTHPWSPMEPRAAETGGR